MSSEQFTSSDLKSLIVNTLNKVADGEITPAAANAASNLAGKLLQAVKMEVDYNKLQGTSPNLEFFTGYSSPKTKLLDAPKRKYNKKTGELVD